MAKETGNPTADHVTPLPQFQSEEEAPPVETLSPAEAEPAENASVDTEASDADKGNPGKKIEELNYAVRNQREQLNSVVETMGELKSLLQQKSEAGKPDPAKGAIDETAAQLRKDLEALDQLDEDDSLTVSATRKLVNGMITNLQANAAARVDDAIQKMRAEIDQREASRISSSRTERAIAEKVVHEYPELKGHESDVVSKYYDNMRFVDAKLPDSVLQEAAVDAYERAISFVKESVGAKPADPEPAKPARSTEGHKITAPTPSAPANTGESHLALGSTGIQTDAKIPSGMWKSDV